MLPKRFRLPIQGSIGLKPVFESRSPYATLKRFKIGASVRRVGVIVPKRIFAKPTERNRLRRAVFRIFERQRALFPGSDVLIIIQPRAGAAPHEELVEQLRVFIEKTSQNKSNSPSF